MTSLNEKRIQATMLVVGAVITNSAASAIPTPMFETHKHMALSGVEIGLCVGIYNIYFHKKLTKAQMKQFLTKEGIAVSSGGGLAFVATKAGHSAVAEMLNYVPVVGWGIKAVLSGSITATVGATCITACHTIAQNR